MKSDDLLFRQQRLLIRSAELRLNLSNQTQILKTPLAIADQAKASLQWLYNNPKWPLAAMLILIIIRPRRVITFGTRLWWGWKTFKRVQGLVARLPLQGLFR